jgi:hypothetical protein
MKTCTNVCSLFYACLISTTSNLLVPNASSPMHLVWIWIYRAIIICVQSIAFGWFPNFLVKTWVHKLLGIIKKLHLAYYEEIICKSQGITFQALTHPKFWCSFSLIKNWWNAFKQSGTWTMIFNYWERQFKNVKQ